MTEPYHYSLFKLLTSPLPDGTTMRRMVGFGTATTITQEGDVTVIRDPIKDSEEIVNEKAEDIERSLKEKPDTWRL